MINKKTNKLPIETTILVATGDQALPTGALVTGTTALNLAAGQVGVLSYDPTSVVRKLGNFLVSGDDSAEVTAIKLVQGTPKSSATQTVSLWEDGDKALVESGIIRRNQVQAVSVKKADHGQWGGQAFTSFVAPKNDVTYKAFLTIDSHRIDKSFPRNDKTTTVQAPTVNFTNESIAQPLDYVLQNIATQFNSQSKAVSRNGAGMRGNREFVVLGVRVAGQAGVTAPTVPTIVLTSGVITGVTGGTGGSGYTVAPTVTLTGGSPSTAGSVVANISAAGAITGYTIVTPGAGYGSVPTAALSGGAGQALGTITPTTNVAFDLRGGVQQVIQFGFAGVATLADLMQKNTDLIATSTIEVLDAKTAGAGPKVDALIVLGLPHVPAPAFDNVHQIMVTPFMELASGFTLGVVDPTKTIASAKEPVNTGRSWLINWQDRTGLTVHTMQNQPKGDYFLEGKTYINTAKNYVSYAIDFVDGEKTLTLDQVGQKKVVILLPCEVTSGFTANVTNVATRLAAGNPAYPFITSNDAGTGTGSANTQNQLEAVLTGWLEHNRTTGTAFPVTGDAAAGGTYLS